MKFNTCSVQGRGRREGARGAVPPNISLDDIFAKIRSARQLCLMTKFKEDPIFRQGRLELDP